MSLTWRAAATVRTSPTISFDTIEGLTIWQDLRDDGDQEIIFIILHALSPRHDGTGTNKQCPGNYQMKGRGVGSRECTLWRGRGAHFGGEGG